MIPGNHLIFGQRSRSRGTKTFSPADVFALLWVLTCSYCIVNCCTGAVCCLNAALLCVFRDRKANRWTVNRTVFKRNSTEWKYDTCVIVVNWLLWRLSFLPYLHCIHCWVTDNKTFAMSASVFRFYLSAALTYTAVDNFHKIFGCGLP